VALFALGWVAVQALVQPALPLPALEDLQPKLQHLEQAADRYTAVAVGSSRVFREVIPEVFDERMGPLTGREERLFNLGAKGMRLPEAVVVLEWLLERRPQRLELVIFELADCDPFLDPRNALSDREVAWHTWDATRRAVAGAWSDPDPGRGRGERAGATLAHLRHWLARTAAAGRGRELVPLLERGQPGDSVREPMDLAEYMGRTRGWVPLEAEMQAGYEARQAEYRGHIPEYFERVRELRTQRDARRPLSEYEAGLIEQVRALCAGHGLQLVFVIMPSLSLEAHLLRAQDAGRLPELLVYNDPRRYPFFYKPDSRWDAAHLTRPASRVFTARLAAEAAGLLGLAAAPEGDLPLEPPDFVPDGAPDGDAGAGRAPAGIAPDGDPDGASGAGRGADGDPDDDPEPAGGPR
jgi:hypothetical protein